MPKVDLRLYKQDIRTRMRKLRREMPEEIKREKDRAIYERLISMEQYRRAKAVVLYVSKELEVDTHRLMEKAWEDGKIVAAPRCVENTRLMNMHIIRSVDDLQTGAYGLLEPDERLPILHESANAICIVPAFCNDYRGYRVGYGGGYYDRYLSNFKGSKIGVNYSECVRPRLLGGRYDVPIDVLVTDRYIRRCCSRRPACQSRPQKREVYKKERTFQKGGKKIGITPARGRKETEDEQRKG